MQLITAPIVLELTADLPEADADPIVVRVAHVDEPGDVRATLGLHFGRHWACDRIVLAAAELTTDDIEAIRFVVATGATVFRVAGATGAASDLELETAVVAAVQTLETAHSLLILVSKEVSAERLQGVVRRAMAWRATGQAVEDIEDYRSAPIA